MSFCEDDNAVLNAVVSGGRPRVRLSLQSRWWEVCAGERVTLHCQVEGKPDGWRFSWYRNNERDPVSQTERNEPTGSILTFSRAAVSQTGQYRCRAARGQVEYYSEYSDIIQIHVSAVPETRLTLLPSGTELFTGDNVTLSCDIWLRSSDWLYSWYKDSPKTPAPGSGTQYTIQSAALSHRGQYWCRAARDDASFQLNYSQPVTLHIAGGRPRVRLSLQSKWREVCAGERVTLHCRVEGKPDGWRFSWYRNNERDPVSQTERNEPTGSILTFSRAAVSQTGQYRCRAARGQVEYYSEYSDIIQIHVSAVPETRLTLLPSGTELFTGDNVTLSCDIGLRSSDWLYSWYKDSTKTSAPGSGTQYTIQSAALSHRGQYWCRAARDDASFQLSYSQPVTLHIADLLPTLNLTQDPDRKIFEEDAVALRCGAQDGTLGWLYSWYKDNLNTTVHRSDRKDVAGANYSITAVDLSHNGLYWCGAERGEKPIYLNFSQPAVLEVHERPTAVISLGQEWSEVYARETAVLRCSVPGSYPMQSFDWYKDEHPSPVHHSEDENWTILSALESHTGHYSCQGRSRENPSYSKKSSPVELKVQGMVLSGVNYTLTSATVRDSGQYTCSGQRASAPYYSNRSRTVSVRVSDLLPTLSLTQDPDRKIFEGDKVVLRCGAQDGTLGWLYSWYKDNLNTTVHRSDRKDVAGASYSITAVDLSHNGLYWCGAERGEKPIYLNFSQPAVLEVHERPTAVISLGQEWSEVYARETAVLRCSVPGSYPMQSFDWYKDEHPSPVHHSEDENWTILSALESHTGHYSCQGRSRENPSYSKKSSPVELKVQVIRPRTVLSLQPLHTEVFEGDTVTLSCVVEDGSPGWSFNWYKDHLDKPAHNSQSSSYIISPANLSHTGQYWCQAVRGEKPFTLDPSLPIRLNVWELFTHPALSAQPGSSVTEGDSVTLHCDAVLNETVIPRVQP
nr:PREDICTED: Fc receptor-like protein 5 [Lepisosteus oculatus]